MTVVFFDCFSGAAGDMLLGALLDAGAPESKVRDSLDRLRLPGWRLDVYETTRAGLRALRADVTLTESGTHRSYRDVQAILEASTLRGAVRDRALAVFAQLARAEAAVHGTAMEDVVFHEVGATDALVDVVGVCSALEHFQPETMVAGPIATGTGAVSTDHGELPLPAPAVTELLKGVPVVGSGRRELVTPTGAALLATVCDSFGQLPPMTLDAVGYGAGERDTEAANIVRVLVGSQQPREGERATLMETNIDDLNPELLPYVVEQLLEAGAHDVWATPIIMKKGRQATTLSVLCELAGRDKLLNIIFRETTTLGVRVTAVTKHALEREWIDLEVDGYTVRVKIGRRDGAVVTIAPEYEDARAAASATGRPLKEIYAQATATARRAT
jgi:pyridinium-3,5-bisthiocarboxylic acid mononucleotide nickel chelatase